MAFLFTYLLFCGSIHIILCRPSLDFYSNGVQNVLILECIDSGGRASSNARFEFHNSTGALLRDQPTDTNRNYLTYNIARDSEAIVHCTIGDEHSEDITFAALPTVSNQTISTDVFRNTSAMLTCPIPLPTVRSLYTNIVWEEFVNSTPIRLTNDSESREHIFSQDSRTLFLQISSPTDKRIFQCKVKFRQCSDPQRCNILDITGPLMEIKVLEKSAITVTVPPSLQTITIGDTAIFQCNARGSNISVEWVLNGSSCQADNCEQNGISINTTQRISGNTYMINTTLEIRTGELDFFITQKRNYTIQCIVEQNLVSSSLKRDSIDFNITLTVLSDDIAVTNNSTPDRGDISSGSLVIAVSVPISIVLLLGIITVAILAVFCIKKKRIKRIHSHLDIELQRRMSVENPLASDSPSLMGNYGIQVKSTLLGVGKIGPSESFIRNLSESNLLIPGRHIQLEHTIGQGEFGLVYQSYLTGWQGRTTAEVVAVKTLKSFYSAKNIEDLIAESERMKKFSHPNVMNLIGVCIDVGERPYIVMPFMANGCLLAYLKKNRPHLTLAEGAGEEMIEDAQRKLLSMCLQIAKGMCYLAEQKFVHRDLAARNCMIDEHFLIKVGDFGLSEEIYTTNYFRQREETSVKLPIKWMALESLLDGIFSEKTDVWSFGVTCWEIFSLGHTPYPAVDPFTLVKFLKSGERLEQPSNGCTDQVYGLITQCWDEEPEKRPSFEDLVHEISSQLERVAGYIEFSAFFGKLGL